MDNEIFEKEIFSQPDDMLKTIEFIRNNNESIDINISDINRIIFVGSGDSYIAPHSLLLIILKYINANILILTPLEVFNYSYKLDDLVVLISFSGESKQLIRTNKYLNTFKCRTVSITFNSKNTISDGCNYNYKIPVKSNRLTPHATDYMNTLLAITLLIENIIHTKIDVIDELPIKVKDQIQYSYPLIKNVCMNIYKSRNYIFLGSGNSYGTCKYASAKLWEAGGIQSVDCKLDEFPHGMHLMANNTDTIFIISSAKKEYILVDEMSNILQNIVKNVFVITNSLQFNNNNHLIINNIEEGWQPFLETILIQLICMFISNNNNYDVIKKNGINRNYRKYSEVHKHLVR